MRNRKNKKEDKKDQGFLSMDEISKIQEQIKKDQKKKKRFKKADGKFNLFFL